MSRTNGHHLKSNEDKAYVSEIDPSLLTHAVVNDKQTECYLGRGSFGIVKLMMYRGMHVAVKQLHTKSLLEEVKKKLN